MFPNDPPLVAFRRLPTACRFLFLQCSGFLAWNGVGLRVLLSIKRKSATLSFLRRL